MLVNGVVEYCRELSFDGVDLSGEAGFIVRKARSGDRPAAMVFSSFVAAPLP